MGGGLGGEGRRRVGAFEADSASSEDVVLALTVGGEEEEASGGWEVEAASETRFCLRRNKGRMVDERRTVGAVEGRETFESRLLLEDDGSRPTGFGRKLEKRESEGIGDTAGILDDSGHNVANNRSNLPSVTRIRCLSIKTKKPSTSRLNPIRRYLKQNRYFQTLNSLNTTLS